MREIKFRGKKVSNEKWVYGFVFINADLEHMIKEHIIMLKTLGQYIGVKDSKGKEIYEGDIVKCWDEGSDIDDEPDGVFEVVYCGANDYPAFDLKGFPEYVETNGISHYIASGTMVVIGNIHDNPEMLKEAK